MDYYYYYRTQYVLLCDNVILRPIEICYAAARTQYFDIYQQMQAPQTEKEECVYGET